MRRISLVTPLLLILVGGMFLASNILPGFSVIGILSRFWPFLLIGWGALRLVEIASWFSAGRPLPASGLNGGEWVLVILLTVFGASSGSLKHKWNGIRFTPAMEVFGESFDYPLEATKPAGHATRLVIENLRGNARIIGSDTGEVKISGRKTIRAFNKADADSADRESPLEFTVQGDQIVVRTSQERVQGDRRMSADLEISLPRSVSVEGRGRYGDFEINDVTGGVEIVSDNAGVRVQNIGGSLRVDLKRSDIVRAVNVKGAVELKGRGQDVELENIEGQVSMNANYSGEVQLRNLAKPLHYESDQTELRIARLPGHLTLTRGNLSGANVIGPVTLTSHNRDVNLSDFTESLTVAVDRGDIELHPGRQMPKIEARSKNGNIELAVLPAARFELHAATRRGEVENEFGAPFEIEQQGHRGNLLRGVLGNGPSVNLETDHGSITVRKAGADENASGAEPKLPKLPRIPEAPEPPTPPEPLRVEKQ